MLGVPGLVQAVRSGTVSVANALGSGLAESQEAYAAFLPGLCETPAGRGFEGRRRCAVPRWWPARRSRWRSCATEHLKDLVIKPSSTGAGGDPIFGEELSAGEREELIAKMRARPGRYVAQEHVDLSTVPVWEEGALQPRHLVMRGFAVSTGSSYLVMPGGLEAASRRLPEQRRWFRCSAAAAAKTPGCWATVRRRVQFAASPTHPFWKSAAPPYDLPRPRGGQPVLAGAIHGARLRKSVVRLTRAGRWAAFSWKATARGPTGLPISNGLHRYRRRAGFLPGAEREKTLPESDLMAMMCDPARSAQASIRSIVAELLRECISFQSTRG